MTRFLLLNVLHDTLTDRIRKRISQKEVVRYCGDLAKIIQKNYSPDFVIAVGTGGSIPGELIAKMLGIPVVHTVIRRNITIRVYNHDPLPLRWMMRLYHHFLFHTTKPTVITEINVDISGKKVLIIDDVFHTGATIDVAIEYLERASASQIKTATLSYVSKRKPDFLILPIGNYSFPWSKDFIPESEEGY